MDQLEESGNKLTLKYHCLRLYIYEKIHLNEILCYVTVIVKLTSTSWCVELWSEEKNVIFLDFDNDTPPSDRLKQYKVDILHNDSHEGSVSKCAVWMEFFHIFLFVFILLNVPNLTIILLQQFLPLLPNNNCVTITSNREYSKKEKRTSSHHHNITTTMIYHSPEIRIAISFLAAQCRDFFLC